MKSIRVTWALPVATIDSVCRVNPAAELCIAPTGSIALDVFKGLVQHQTLEAVCPVKAIITARLVYASPAHQALSLVMIVHSASGVLPDRQQCRHYKVSKRPVAVTMHSTTPAALAKRLCTCAL